MLYSLILIYIYIYIFYTYHNKKNCNYLYFIITKNLNHRSQKFACETFNSFSNLYSFRKNQNIIYTEKSKFLLCC